MIVLEELIQIDAEQLEDKAEMFPPEEAVSHSDNVMLVVHVNPLVQELKHSNFHSSLQVNAFSLCMYSSGAFTASRYITNFLQ